MGPGGGLCHVFTPPKFNMKIDGWKTTFLLNGLFSRDIRSFSGRVSFLNIILDFWIYIKAYRFPT